MRAVAVTPGTKDSLHLRDDVPAPEPGPGEAIIQVLETGVCGTDAEIHQGLYGQAPPGSDFLILGHESLGVVESGSGESGLAPGDLVVATVRRPCPEMCGPCSSGQNDMCLTGHFKERGIGGLHGFMSDRYAESPRYLVRVPAPLRPFAVLTEPMTIVEKGIEQAFRAQERLPWGPQQAVVLGAGPVGMLAAAALRLRGFEVTVAALEPEGSFKDTLLAEAGIEYVSTRSTPLDALRDKLDRIDVVFEATGAAAVVFPALQLLGPNGVGILTSVTGGQRKLEVDVAGWNREMVLGNRLVFGTVNAARRHFEAALRDFEAAESRLPGWLGRLITRRLPVSEAMSALVRSPEDIKTVLEFA
jgi:threonine dehydrogenase-like Zn-dependent dehydrogenase